MLKYAQEGARVVVAEINSDRGQSTVQAIHKQGGEGVFAQTDVSSVDQVKEMVRTTIKRFGRIDILVNNAAILITHGETRAHAVDGQRLYA